MLTLDARVCSAKTEEVGDGGELARSAAAGVDEDDGDPENGGDPARFLLQEYRVGHGGAIGWLGLARDALKRRRRARPWRRGFGPVEENRRGGSEGAEEGK